jgi:hypothetical protein
VPGDELITRAEADAAVRAAEERLKRQHEAYLREVRHEDMRPLRATISGQETADFPPKERQGKPRATRRGKDPVTTLVDHALERSSVPRDRWTTPKAMDPAQQVAPKSYLGKAFNHLDEPPHRRAQRKDPDETSSAPSDFSSLTESYDSSDDSSSSSGANNSRYRRARAKRRRERSKKKSTLKPIPPVNYDGSPDSRAFHQFLTEGTAYVKDGRVERKRRMYILAHHLKGRAHEFYI